MPMCAESYSMIAMPNADSHNQRVLQEDNTELAYECKLPRLKPHHANHASPCALASKQSRASFRVTLLRVRAAIEPRAYTHGPPTRLLTRLLSLRSDLDTKGIHEVAARRFCLVAAGALLPNQTHDPRQSLPPHPNLHRPPARVRDLGER